MVGDVYRRRLDALEQIWQAWTELGRGLTEQQWATPTRCPGWDVACVYAHVSMFPLEMSVPPPPAPVDQPVGLPVTAVQLLRQYNTPTGVATTMAATIADNAVIEAAQHSRAQLVQRFTVYGPRAIQGLRATAATTVGPGSMARWWARCCGKCWPIRSWDCRLRSRPPLRTSSAVSWD
jgi:Mycothiol maleylpyruvate isomerase N-terminal domain